MNRHRGAKWGFTLVELLVVMAIISILAAIVVPNVQRYIVRARVARAVSEINGAELAMTAMLTDAGKSNFNQLFNPDAVRGFLKNSLGTNTPLLNESERGTPEFFNAAVALYTSVAYDLLNYGRNVLRGDGSLDYQILLTPDPNLTPPKPLINRDVLAKLGDQYMALGNDPWGNDYRFFPGPWRVHTYPAGSGNRAPIVFRKFTVEQSSSGSQRGARNDGYVLNNAALAEAFGDIIESPETWPTNVGYPAETGKAVYIWSYGANLRNGQMIYQLAYTPLSPSNQTAPRTWYDVQDEADIGGGDDINNWDPGASWQRFYN